MARFFVHESARDDDTDWRKSAKRRYTPLRYRKKLLSIHRRLRRFFCTKRVVEMNAGREPFANNVKGYIRRCHSLSRNLWRKERGIRDQ
jgi:hypothetical protein